MDAVANFGYTTIATAPSPATSGTSLVVTSNVFTQTPPFNVVVWGLGERPLSTNAEIVRVTANSSGTLTIERNQEGTSTRAIQVGDQIMSAVTAKLFNDLNSATTPGTWKALELTAKVEAVSGFEEPAARLENNGTTVRLRGAVRVKTGQEVKTSTETIMTLATGLRPKTKVQFGISVLEKEVTEGVEKNHVGALKIASNGTVSDDEVPVPAGVTYLLDGITFNIT